MRLIGHGVDIVDIPDLTKLVDAPGGHFLSRNFTARELEDVGNDVRRYERLAGRFAAKEAVAKAAGVGWGEGFGWNDIEILTRDSGAPYVELSVRARGLFDSVSISGFMVSISHANEYAVGSAIAFSD